MNILYIANARIPTEKAHGIAILHMCEALARAGARVTLIVPKRKTSSSAGLSGHFSMVFLPTIDLFETVVPDRLAFIVQATTFYATAFIWLMWGSRGRVVYARHIPVAFAAWLGYRVVYECHIISSHRRLFFFAARRAHRIVTISQGLKDEFIRAGFGAEHILVAQSGIDLSEIPPVPKAEARLMLGVSNGEKAVVYTGHLQKKKGVGTLAQAARHVAARIYFVGGTAEDIKAFKEKYGHDSNIRVVGHVPHERALLWQRAADVLALPNSARDDVSSRYTSPMKLFEYMASGAPIVASDVPALREVLDDSTALFVAPDDPAALARGIEALLTDPERASRLPQQARGAVEAYTWERRAKRILALLS